MMDEKSKLMRALLDSVPVRAVPVLRPGRAIKTSFDGNNFNVEVVDIYPAPAKRCLCCGGRNVNHDA